MNPGLAVLLFSCALPTIAAASTTAVTIDPLSYIAQASAGLGETNNNVDLEGPPPDLPVSVDAAWDHEFGSEVSASAGVTITGAPLPAILVTAALSTDEDGVGEALAHGELTY